MITYCPACDDLYIADPGHTCPACKVGLEVHIEARRRVARATVPLAPEAVAEEITARLRAIAVARAAEPAPERVVFRWPDDPRADLDPDEITGVH